MRTFNTNSTVQTVNVTSSTQAYVIRKREPLIWGRVMSLSHQQGCVNFLFHSVSCSTLAHITVCENDLVHKQCNAKPPDVKSQIIRPGFATAFISLPNLALLRGFKLWSLMPKSRWKRGGVGGGMYALLRMSYSQWFVLASVCVTAARVSWGNSLHKASLRVDSGLCVANDSKK